MPDQESMDQARLFINELVAMPGFTQVTLTMLTETRTKGLGMKEDETTSVTASTTLAAFVGPQMGMQVNNAAGGQQGDAQWVAVVPIPSTDNIGEWCADIISYQHDETTNKSVKKILMIDGEQVDVTRVEPDYFFNAARITFTRDNLSQLI